MRTTLALCVGTASAFMATGAPRASLAARKATETLPEGEFEYRVAILGDLHVHSSALVTFIITARHESVSEPRRSTRGTWTTRWRAAST